MVEASGQITGVIAAVPVREPQPAPKRAEPRAFAETPSYQAAARAPASLSIIPADTGLRLIYVFRDPESGETIRQYPTRPMVALGGVVDEAV
jgi:hypothetical protein